VQTLYPAHYSVRLACRQDYPAFFEREVEYRKGLRYPPFVALVNAVVRGRTFDEAMRLAQDLASALAARAAAGGFAVLGPRPAPLTRLRGEHRVQIFLKGGRSRSDAAGDARGAGGAARCPSPRDRRYRSAQRALTTVVGAGFSVARVAEGGRYFRATRSSVEIGSRREAQHEHQTGESGEPAAGRVQRHVLVVVRGWRGPKKNSIASGQTVHTIHDEETNDRPERQRASRR
jgi:hypothetical protein